MTDREHRLEQEVARLKSDRDALIKARDEQNKLLQQVRNRYAKQVQEKDAEIVRLHDQILDYKTSSADYKRELEDMKAQQEVEGHQVCSVFLAFIIS